MANPGATSPANEDKSVEISATSVSDQAASKDSLGFESYVEAIAEFLTSSETKPPLTLSVEGPWGSGKSSFMQQLQQAIEIKTQEQSQQNLSGEREKSRKAIQKLNDDLWKGTKKLFSRSNQDWLRKRFPLKKLFPSLIFIVKVIVLFPVFCFLILIRVLRRWYTFIWLTLRLLFPRKPRIVWFNAWRHDKAEALWAAFALTFLEEISKQRHWLDILSLWGGIRLFWFRLEKSLSGLVDLFRTIAQITLFVCAIVLVLIFTLFKSTSWSEQLATDLSNIADNLGRKPELAEVIFTDKVNKAINQLYCNTLNQLPPSNSLSSEKSKFCQSPETSKAKPEGQPQTESKSNQDSAQNNVTEKQDENNSSDLPWIQNPLFGAIVGTGGLTTLWLLQRLQKVIGSPKKQLTEYLKSPKYDDQVSFIEQFHTDFKKIVDAYAGKGNKVYVFIDDLDRCDVPKSAELMQAINLMIANDPQLIFILGMDREKVAAGLAVKHQAIIPYLASARLHEKQENKPQNNNELQGLEYGYAFIEKFVQLSFLLPQPSPADFDGFLKALSPTTQSQDSVLQSIWTMFSKSIQNSWNSLMDSGANNLPEEPSGSRNALPPEAGEPRQEGEWERKIRIVKGSSDSPEVKRILRMVAPTLDWNPRRLKRFLNLFRLKVYIADATNLFSNFASKDASEQGTDQAITLEQLGKFTAIMLQYPLLAMELTKQAQVLEPASSKEQDNLLVKLQRYALSPDTLSPDTSDPNLPWSDQPKLMALLRYGCGENNTPDDLKREMANLKREIKYADYSFESVKLGKLLQVSPLDPIDRVRLRSDKNIDYSKLRDLLRNRKWRDADQETFKVMLKAAIEEEQGHLTSEGIKKIPCPDLQTIDQLWVKASNGKFGFSVQKRIWKECGSPMEYNNDWRKFCDRVGWRKEGEWVDYDNLTFALDKSLEGELPIQELLVIMGFIVFSSLAQRLANCNIQ
jgi:hypothetical protein